MGTTPTLVTFEEALSLTQRLHAAPSSERVLLLASLGRVLAQDIHADRDQPPFHRSTRDGFALRASEAGSPLRIAGQLRAGDPSEDIELPPVSAIEIMTGAALPFGADCVAMVEHVLVQDGEVRLTRSIFAGENVVPRGAEARLGDLVLRAGTRITAAEIALAANCGCADLAVFAMPAVAIIATGDELVEVAETPGPHAIRNSNSYALAAMVAAAGAEPMRLPIARDLRQEVRDRITEGRKADLLVLSGGVSMGEYDLVEEVLAEFHAEFIFTGVHLQPGKPAVFGRLPALDDAPARYFFGLPGNPISTQVTFHCFAEPFIRALSGEIAPTPCWAQATLAEPVAAKPSLTRLLPARLDGIEVRITPWQGSGDLAANARANCYAELLPGQSYVAGEVIRILLR